MRKFILIITGLLAMNGLLTADTISSYLHSSKQDFERLRGHSQVHFVMGNEAADLDSVVSSIAFAYLLQKENPNDLYIPLVNMQRHELNLRPDVLYILNNHLSLDNLLFLNEASLEELHKSGLLRLNLVDHNVLTPRQRQYSSTVERVVDHHVDEKVQYPLLVMKNITVIGSTASLITEYFQKSIATKMNSDIALMLFAPILIDTNELKNKDKTTQRDIDAVNYLQTYAEIPSKYCETIFDKKHNVDFLTPEMAFAKDYKAFLDDTILYGIASIPQSIYWGQTKVPELIPDLEKFAQERNLTFLILLMYNPDKEGPKRVLLVYSSTEELSSAFKNYVKDDEVLQEQFTLLTQVEDPRVLLYGSNKNTSRKQIQPMFHFSDSEEIMGLLPVTTK